MANKVTETNQVKLDVEFADGDTRTIALDDPKSNLTASQFESVANVLKTTNAIIGDKAGAAFSRIRTATTVENTRIQLDLK